MGFKVDFSEFNRMAKKYEQMEKEFNQFLEKFLVEMAERILARTKPKTPVDTGALRSAWELGSITGSGREISIEILNPMEYATDIEYGHRIVVGTGQNKKEVGWYNGKFMLKTSIDEIQKQMPFRFNYQFADFCKRLGIE